MLYTNSSRKCGALQSSSPQPSKGSHHLRRIYRTGAANPMSNPLNRIGRPLQNVAAQDGFRLAERPRERRRGRARLAGQGQCASPSTSATAAGCRRGAKNALVRDDRCDPLRDGPACRLGLGGFFGLQPGGPRQLLPIQRQGLFGRIAAVHSAVQDRGCLPGERRRTKQIGVIARRVEAEGERNRLQVAPSVVAFVRQAALSYPPRGRDRRCSSGSLQSDDHRGYPPKFETGLERWLISLPNSPRSRTRSQR
jgi:hypothetical protein